MEHNDIIECYNAAIENGNAIIEHYNAIIEDNYAYNMYKLRWLETCECMSLHQVCIADRLCALYNIHHDRKWILTNN